ncbi:MAG: hypothetical protein IJK81_11540 [Selenomonadaceae bacterium]|nr:hypothetical protein [Selenomonadaceae bacterium]
MTESKTNLTITQEDDGSISIQGDDEAVKKASMAIARLILSEDELTEPQLETIVRIAENFYNCEKGSPEDKAAKEFLEAIEKYKDKTREGYTYPYQYAMYELALREENPLIAEAKMLRAATAVEAGPAIAILIDEYEAQAAYWRKRNAEVKGKTFDSEAPTTEEILDSDRLRFFNIYKRAFNGDPKAIEICLEFCEEEEKYWKNH